MKELAVKEFGSIEEWKKHYIKTVSSEEMQKGYAKVVSGMEEKSNSCLLPTILLAKRLQKVTTNNLTIFYTN